MVKEEFTYIFFSYLYILNVYIQTSNPFKVYSCVWCEIQTLPFSISFHIFLSFAPAIWDAPFVIHYVSTCIRVYLKLFLIDLLAILACLFSHTNVNNNLSLMANMTQLCDAKLRKQFRSPEVHSHWQLIIQPMGIHARDLGPGRRLRIQRQYPRWGEESHRGKRQTPGKSQILEVTVD